MLSIVFQLILGWYKVRYLELTVRINDTIVVMFWGISILTTTLLFLGMYKAYLWIVQGHTCQDQSKNQTHCRFNNLSDDHSTH